MRAIGLLAERLREAGLDQESDFWSHKFTEQIVNRSAFRRSVELLSEGKFAEGRSLLLGEPGDRLDYTQLLRLVRLLSDHNLAEQLEGLLRFLVIREPGYSHRLYELARLLRSQNRLAEANKVHREHVRHKSYHSNQPLVDFLHDIGRNDEARQVDMYGIEPGGATVNPW